MTTTNRCQYCPVRPGLACLGERHSPVCRDVEAGMPGRAEQLVALAERPPEPPGLLAMAKNLTRSVVHHVAGGGRIAPPEVQAGRKALCFSCSHLDKERDRCLSCGCTQMDIKRSWSSERCPLDPPRWDAV